MSEYETTGSDIAKLVRKSARSTIYFAFSPGLDAKDSWLALNKRKNASHLHKVAKREGPSQKVASGKMALDGREVCLTCHTQIPALARKFKYFLQDNGMSFKVRVLDRNGELIDTDQEKATRDEDDENPQDQDVAAADEAQDDPDENEDMAAEDNADVGDEEDEDTPTAAPEPPAENKATEKLRKQYDGLAPLIGRVRDGDDPDAVAAIEQLGSMFEKLAGEEDTDRAAKTLKVLKRKLIGALRDQRPVGQEDAEAQAAS